MKQAILVAMIFVAFAPSVRPGDKVMPVNGIEYLSLIRLIANPEQFNGKAVSTIGFLQMGSETDLLFVGGQDSLNDIDDNAVWIKIDPSVRKAHESLDQEYVLITGHFSSKNAGTISAGIADVTRIQLWSDPKNPRHLQKQAEWGR